MVEYGLGPNGFPFHRFGNTGERIVLIPGVMDALGWNTPSFLKATLLASYYFRGFRSFDVWVLSRPPGLDQACTIEEIAARYQDTLDAIGPAHLVGITFGGYIASHVAKESPQVKSLTLISAGSGFGERGKRILQHWEQLAARNAYGRIHTSYARTVYSGWRRQAFTSLYRLGAFLIPAPTEPGDFELSCALTRKFCSDSIYQQLDVSVLLIAGRDDILVPQTKQREALRQLPDGRLVEFDAGSAVFEERRRPVTAVIRDFLNECSVV